MRTPLEPGSEGSAIVDDELAVLGRVHALIDRRESDVDGPGMRLDLDADLIALRDQIAEEKEEDLPVLVEHMTRVQALAAGRRARASLPVDAASPYFAHLRLRADGGEPRDILIGRRGLIDRAAGVQIVDWRDAPVSQIYYRYDEGDDYDEGALKGVVLARRNVTIAAGALRRIGCPHGTFVSSGEGAWYELSGQGVALLEGGQGTAARPPRPTVTGRRRFETAHARPVSGDKQLPEIAALIDPAQFELITAPTSGLVVIQGGAGSGKTTVALHRIAYLVFHDREAFRPSKCLFVVPSEALARYVSGVLPALGVQGVPVVTFRSWARNLRKRLVPSAPDRYAEETPTAVARLKKHPALLALVERAVDEEVASARQLLIERLGDDGAAVVAAWDHSPGPPVPRARAVRVRVEKGQIALPAATAHRAEQALRTVSARLRDVRRIVAELLTDRARLEPLRSAAVEPAGALELDELVRWSAAQLDEAMPPELDGIDPDRLQPIDGLPLEGGASDDGARGRLDPEDDPLLLRVYQRVHGELQRGNGEPLVYDHVAIDEAQDLCAVEVKVLYQALSDRRSCTIAGDVAQRVVFDNGFRGWPELVADLGAGEVAGLIRPLRLAYRSTAPVMRFARAVLGPLDTGGDEVAGREGAEVSLHAFTGMGEAVGFVAEALRSLLAREPMSSVALITRHVGQADAWHTALVRAEVPLLRRVRRQDFVFQPGVDLTDVSQVKGLEFDYVILLDVNATSYPVTVESRHLLHIGATRATHQLWLVTTGPVSELVDEVERRGEAEEAISEWSGG